MANTILSPVVPSRSRDSDRPSVCILGTRGYPSYYGGFETAVRKIAPFLAATGWDVTVYGRPGGTREFDPDLDVRVHRRLTRGIESKSLSTLTHGFSAAVSTAKTRPDVALVMNVANGFWIPLLKARGIPSVVNVDGIEWEREKWGRAARVVFRGGAAITAKKATTLVYDSVEIAKRWESTYHREGEVIAYGGEPAADLPIESGFIHRGYVLMVARLVPENSVPEFFAVAAKLSQTYPVIIVGSTGYGGELDTAAQKLAADNSGIHWLGHISDDRRLFALWQHAGVYFHGHSVGGTNPALVQAMSCGAPIIARDTVYNREVLGMAGRFTEVTPNALYTNLSDAMTSVATCETYSAAAKARAQKHYSWIEICEKYEQTLLAAIRTQGKVR
ncbi:DUF1972 domain-containing protein [Cryobacterium sp. Y82]|uniref:DUF1972 domain-containing protein n=1 Tax=Cryobacterium sp. Y82 TaxID=2045017 RepID=UPI000CE3AD36|nr:DUF1972 domain-containing protein [Cryobacterium sp. Y82]